MDLFTHYQQLIEKSLKSFDLYRTPHTLYEPVSYVLQEGGKRIRPLFVLLAHHLFNGKNESSAVTASIGFEIFHNFTLLHDDIMDNADIRRNRPTVHKKWNENTAILSGDAMMILAYEQFLKLPEKYIAPALKIFNKTALEVCEGQQFDMDFETQTNVSIKNYLEMIRLKTAVLLAAALKTGALLADASTDQQTKIYDAGIQLGLAFQLQDDYLDTFGNVDTFGKKTGGDILEHKKTALLINAYKLADKQQKATLDNDNLTDEKRIEAVKKIYVDLGVDKMVKADIEHYYSQAITIFTNLNENNETASALIGYIGKLKQRIS